MQDKLQTMSSELQCTVCSLEPPETSKVFPYPHKDSELFRLWKRSAGKPENWQPDSTDGFCKIHFSDDQFVSSKVSDAALKLTPKAIPKINLGMCFVCYQNQVSWQGFALTDKSEHSDKTLFQIFGKLHYLLQYCHVNNVILIVEQVMKSKIIIPSVRLCPDCDAGMNEFDFLITEAENIQKKFQGLLQQRTKSIGNNTNINKSTITTSAAPAPLPAQKIDTIDLLSDDEQELSESDPVADEDDALEEKSQSDSDTDSSDEKMLDESSNDVMIDFEEQLSELNKVPTVDPSSMITEEKCSYNETYYDMKDVDMTDCRSETVQAFQVTNAPSTSNECPPKVVIGLNPKVTFKLLECLKCSKVYNSQRAFEIHKKMHDIKANFLPCERCNRPINLQFYVTHTMTCLGYDPDFLKCVVSNCGIHFKFVEDLAEHLRKHKADPNFLSVVNAQSTLDGEPSILGKEKNPPATKIKPTIILKNKPKKRPKKYDCKNLPSRKRYPCEKCGKGFALGELISYDAIKV